MPTKKKGHDTCNAFSAAQKKLETPRVRRFCRKARFHINLFRLLLFVTALTTPVSAHQWKAPTTMRQLANGLVLAQRTIELDPTLAEPHAALAVLKEQADWDWAEGEPSIARLSS
jgi:hypothetical protein